MRRSLLAITILALLFAVRICQSEPEKVVTLPAAADSLAPVPPSPEELELYGIEKPE